MGWYGKGIMDGDEPMDWCHTLTNLAGAYRDNCDYGKPRPEFKHALESRQHQLVEKVVKASGEYGRVIAAQVLGVLVINQGAKMGDAAKKLVLDACDNDEWAKRDLERKIYVSEFADIVRAYCDNPEPVPTKEYADWTKKYGLTQDDLNSPRLSGAMLQIAMGEVAEHLARKPWFEGVRFAVNSGGYRILVVVSEKNILRDGGPSILSDEDIPSDLFEIPVSLYVDDQKTVMKKGDKIWDE